MRNNNGWEIFRKIDLRSEATGATGLKFVNSESAKWGTGILKSRVTETGQVVFLG